MKEIFQLAKKMTFITFFLLLLGVPLVFLWGGFFFFLGLLIGFLLSLLNFYFSLYSASRALKPVSEGKRPLSLAQGLLLLGFWFRLGALGAVLYLLARISEALMFASLVAFLVFYGILFVSEIRLLSQTRIATDKKQMSTDK